MTNHMLEVILKMRDEASKKIEQFSQKVQNEMDRAGAAMIKFGQQISKIGKDMTIIGAAITGPLSLAFKTTADYSVEASEVLKRLDDSAKAFQITIGTALLPVVEKVSNVIAALTKWFEALDPKMRDAILQGALMTGILLTLGGALTYVIGKVIDLGGRLLKFASAHPVLLLISAALIFMIMNWEKVREVAIPVLNAIEIGAEMVAIGFQKIVSFMADALVGITSNLERILYYLSVIPGPQQKIFQSLREGAQQTKEFLTAVSDAAKTTIEDLERDITNTMQSGKGHVASFVDEGIITISNLVDYFNNTMVPGIDAAMQNFSQGFREAFKKAYEEAVSIGKKTYQILDNQINMFSQKVGESTALMIMHGKNFGESMKQAFHDMAEIFIAEVIRMMVQWAAFLALKAAANFLGIPFHQGGMVMHKGGAIMHHGGPIYAHAGLAIDEVPIIAQRGEGILSRRGMATIGGSAALSSYNQGRLPASSATYINIEINGPVIREDQDIDTLTEEISRRIARGTSR